MLGLSSSCDKVLKECQKEITQEKGHGLGRDAIGKFVMFRSSGESAASRYVRTACDVLGPRGDEKNGCRIQWEAYCSEVVNEHSKITSFRMNRFNNYFHGAASLFYHRNHILDFLVNYKTDLNLKIESVLYDCQSEELQTFIRSLGIIYYGITGPFWNMLHGNVQYVDLYLYVQRMLQCFREWSEDASPLLVGACIWPEFGEPESNITASLYSQSDLDELTQKTLEKIMVSFIEVTERQLADFLPDGKYGAQPSDQLREEMQHCKLTNLISEYDFGDLDYSQFRRRNASLHYHSGVQMVKRNKTISGWLVSKSEQEQSRLMQLARDKSGELRHRHRQAEKAVLEKTKARLEQNFRKKK